MLVKSAKDTRYNSSAVTSHDGDSMSCVAIGRLSELKDAIGSAAYASTEVLAIDEARVGPGGGGGAEGKLWGG